MAGRRTAVRAAHQHDRARCRKGGPAPEERDRAVRRRPRRMQRAAGAPPARLPRVAAWSRSFTSIATRRRLLSFAPRNSRRSRNQTEGGCRKSHRDTLRRPYRPHDRARLDRLDQIVPERRHEWRLLGETVSSSPSPELEDRPLRKARGVSGSSSHRDRSLHQGATAAKYTVQPPLLVAGSTPKSIAP
jgi:hypothetical protein